MANAVLKGFNDFGVFGDEVYTSTDLNRRSGEVFNQALASCHDIPQQ